MLGAMHDTGQGVRTDHALAVHYYRQATDQGHAEGRCCLGICYRNSSGVPQCHAEAARYFRLAADQGYATAQYNYATTCFYGEGVPQDHEEGARYYRLAADQGEAQGQCNYAMACRHGEGVPREHEEGARYHRLAADQGFAPSMLALGARLVDDQNVPADESTLDPALAGVRAGAKLLARAAQSVAPQYASARLDALEALRRHADKREVVWACCIGCGATHGLKRCAKCDKARSCGMACIRRMWSTHNRCCKEWAEPQ
mmetsp:Transcript_40602/g.100344  ORF Transcript_40602/g.100344 Transcript_40602/m.100344 type:complete len:258 (+) Transcript_40602:176-949(+)